MVSNQLVANRVIINAAEHDDIIESVTIFQSNRAEIKRRIYLDLKKGQNYVRIERLSSGVNEDSIQVDGTGAAVISDVTYHAPSRDQWNSATTTTATTDLRRALEALQKERNIAQQQSEFLEGYGRTLDSRSINIEDVHRFLDTFGPRQLAVAKRIQELDIQIDDSREKLKESQRKEFEDVRGAQRGTAITVTVLAEADGSVELMLTYVVSGANWTPLYDVRASIAKTPEGASTIALHYRASITQTTGENWSDVALTLSTATPQLGNTVPKLLPWRIGIPAPVARHPSASANAAFSPRSPMYHPTSPLFNPTSPCYSPCEDVPHGALGAPMGYAPRPPMATRQVRVASVGVLNTTFGIPGRSNIPSDEGSHKVIIAVLELPVDLERVCVPREKESVFLACKAVNSTEFTLLPGGTSVFVDGNFVSKGRIEHVPPNESFKISLGVDSALRVAYPTAKTLKRTATQAGFSFTAKEKQTISAKSQRITIRNSRKAPVSVCILDHVPVSTDACIKVNVVSPSGLDVAAVPTLSTNKGIDKNQVEGRPWKKIRQDLKARWAPPETGGEGIIEWSCDVEPSNEAEVELSWEVSVPHEQRWVDL